MSFVDPSYEKLHTLSNVWQCIYHEKLTGAKSSEAYLVRTKDKAYVLKRIPNVQEHQLRLQKEISDFVGEELLSRVLYWGIKDEHGVQVLNFFEGCHRQGKIENEELISSVYKLSRKLRKFQKKVGKNFGEEMKTVVESLEDSPLKEYGKTVINNKRFIHMTNPSAQVLVHYDLHRYNTIFTEDGIRFIDLGAFMLAPEQFQPASFFMASLLLEELEDFNLENILSCWKETISREDIILLMGARALMGGAFFQSRSNKSKEDTKLYERYLRSIAILKNL